MAAKSWYWRRLTDTQLEAAAVRWTDLEAVAYYNGQTLVSEKRQTVVDQIMAEIDRRYAQPALFEDREGMHLKVAA